MTYSQSNISIQNPQGIKYLASPYTSNEVMQGYRYQDAVRCLTYYTKAGVVCFSPIVHNHPVAQLIREADGRDRPGWEYWEMFDRAFLESSSALWILATDGWRESVGIKAEVGIAKELKLPLFMVEPNGAFDYWRNEYSYQEFAKAVNA